MEDFDLHLLNLGESFANLGLNHSSNLAKTNLSDEFSFDDFYTNYSESMYSAQNFTALEDFEVFDWRDLMNVIACSVMSLGKYIPRKFYYITAWFPFFVKVGASPHGLKKLYLAGNLFSSNLN